ncbi:MAG: 16S rRNA (guanine(527)-N(7))-methyltransferase RsmG [candidate division WOR-3 bacterium]|nr:MAG: 16S rRNA (guanine(527)-N(7))-methyltransferase RsmG [candidate division WOR-3 bacterium]
MRSKNENSQLESMEREVDDLRRGLTELRIDSKTEIITQFRDYLRILHSYHGKLHLVSHRDYERISRRHFLPSLAAIEYLQNHQRVCDVGAGAGFPSIPLKLVLPGLDLVIFESVAKKARFLQFLVEGLRLSGVEIRNERAEDYEGKQFDLMLFKAVGKIGKMLRVVDRLLLSGGEAVFFKSPAVNAELEQAENIIRRRSYKTKVINISTPVEKLPLALVIISKPS